MMQNGAKKPRSPRRLLLAACLWAAALSGVDSLGAADRTTLLLPLEHDQATTGESLGTLADEAVGDAADEGWRAYMRVWKAHHQDPANAAIRRFLGLPLKSSFQAGAQRGTAALRSVNWRRGTYAQVDTPHFVIYSHASEADSTLVAEDLERCYWVWTQMFFPLWEAGPQISLALRDMPADQPIAEFLQKRSARITIRRKLRVVLFRDAAEYRDTLAKRTPGIERSTGYYNNNERTTYLYVADTDDAATRRHEMVHQLFREATRSGLGRSMPGERDRFWLIEGIAGYFESLFLRDDCATVGGWDSSRLQFARHRVLLNGDRMPFDELQADGWKTAQQRSDIARWYAHAIAQTHHLLDGGQPARRQWIYRQLAELYRIRADLAEVEIDSSRVDRSFVDFLSIDDDQISQNPSSRPLQELVLAGCEVSEKGLGLIPPAPELKLLDLSRLRIGNDAVRRLVPNPSSLEQLSLEATAIDNGLSDWLGKAVKLRELDLSGTRVDDAAIQAVAGAAGLETLWMTGANVTDASLATIAGMRALRSVDLQRSRVSDQGIGRLRASRPQLEINPFVLQ